MLGGNNDCAMSSDFLGRAANPWYDTIAALCSHALVVSLPPHLSHLVRLALFAVVVSVAGILAVPIVVAALTRTLRTNSRILEAGLEPAISSLGGRRLIH